ncbi:hypothetical protein KP509_10G011300 [Ceratopteris richardii]|uniref:Receptor-like serine/threonine-protein kinase n=1 Tax=Ceratopteris richardii TaxID=49495 RepID=A0A8T2TW78_CERRI|nr:hypothetical protein KP509_10G011300 [Ceratopteris richardii]
MYKRPFIAMPFGFTLTLLFTITWASLEGLLFSDAANLTSLKSGERLLLNQSIGSPDGIFEFGFFTINDRVYLGVTYANLKPLTAVWVANRNEFVSEAAVCSFTAEGSVNLTDNGKIVWSIGGTGNNASTLLLQNTSNLVLMRSDDSIVWQSFSNPGNTWLPGMSLGPGEKLQSWLTSTDPREGLYYLIMGNNSNFISVYNGTIQYWDSGPWNGNIFSYVPEMTNAFIYTFTFNKTNGFTYYVKANQAAAFNISKFVMNSNGLIMESSYDPSQQNWNDFWLRPNNPCQVTRLCGQYSLCNQASQPTCLCPEQGFRPVNQLEWDQQAYFHGCERKTPISCNKTVESSDGFLQMNQTSFTWTFTSSLTSTDLQTCKELCLVNCSCNGFYFSNDVEGNCSLFSDPLYDGTVSSSSARGIFYLRVASIDLVSAANKNSKSKKGIVVGVAVTIACIIAVIIAAFAAWRVWRRKRLAIVKTPEAGLRAFTYSELQIATKNFKEKLGSGGFGTVYRGFIALDSESAGNSASLAVAVKKLHRLDEGDKQFRAEVRTIGTIQHVNLVRLLGFCSEGKHRLLVYEIAENGSLDRVLFREENDGSACLPWDVRFNVALGAARGIAYLHESCHQCIIHCDIKPENLLLDTWFNVKVADFGLAKLIGREFSHVLTTLRGTRGYLAPEWIAGMPITSKSDVYSFGMTILELISGHRNMINLDENSRAMRDADFFPVSVAQAIHRPEADLLSLLDPKLEGNANMEELQRLAYCAIWCIQDHEDSRPTMGKVVQMLEGSLPHTIPPIPASLECLVVSESSEINSSSYFSQE